MKLRRDTASRLLVGLLPLVYGHVLIKTSSSESADYHNYVDRFLSTGGLPLIGDQPLQQMVMSSHFFYYFGAPLVLAWGPLGPYHLIWTITWLAFTIRGFALSHWLLFLAFFPGPDLITNILRQSLALGILALWRSLPVLPLSVPLALFIHPSSGVSLIFSRLRDDLASFSVRGSLYKLLICGLVIAVFAIAATSVFGELLLSKVAVKLGQSTFGSSFVLFVYFTLGSLLLLAFLIPDKWTRAGYVIACCAVIAATAVEMYLYRLVYIFYPFLLLEAQPGLKEVVFRRLATVRGILALVFLSAAAVSFLFANTAVWFR